MSFGSEVFNNKNPANYQFDEFSMKYSNGFYKYKNEPHSNSAHKK